MNHTLRLAALAAFAMPASTADIAGDVGDTAESSSLDAPTTAARLSFHPVNIDTQADRKRASASGQLTRRQVEAPVFAIDVHYDEQGQPHLTCDVVHEVQPQRADEDQEEQR